MAVKSVAVIAGVGAGTCSAVRQGASIARKFAQTYSVALLARSVASYQTLVQEISSSGGNAMGVNTDVTSDASVKNAFAEISKAFPGAPLAAAIYNVGGGFVRKPFLDLSQEDFTAGYESNAKGAFHFSQAALPLLLKSGDLEHPPTLIFTGATASLKGSSLCASFATGKFAMRALSQSLAREFGPQGIHVCHAIIDGIIDVERTKGFKFDAPDAKLDPNSIAETYWFLHTQPRTTFTQELDMRPYIEKW
ncbi:oxidoreductase [Histoplasma capsulatum]|uniref:Oxidoreductase n=1 Tax=Ajellomyces capsulatus TaxID=5037 RepID=A0A8A1LV40_AJECA|nr:oxidoreductase [Histoplasma capsulatum]